MRYIVARPGALVAFDSIGDAREHAYKQARPKGWKQKFVILEVREIETLFPLGSPTGRGAKAT